jgi:hypothetical protein
MPSFDQNPAIFGKGFGEQEIEQAINNQKTSGSPIRK